VPDEDLRARERAAAHGDAVELLRAARALERAGRVGDAVEALLPGVSCAEVRREAGRLWSHVSLDAGAFVWDTRPPSGTPRLRWHTSCRVPGEPLAPRLQVSPLGVVVNDLGDGHVRVYDLDGGERWSARGGGALLDDDALLVDEGRDTACHDVRSGTRMFDVRGVAFSWRWPGWLLERGGARRLFSRADPRSIPAPSGRGIHRERGFALAPTWFVASGADRRGRRRPDFETLDVATGATLWSGDGQPFIGSSAGVIVRDPAGFALLDLSGRPRWRSSLTMPLALSRDVALAWQNGLGPSRELLALDVDTAAARRIGVALGPLVYFGGVVRDVALVVARYTLAGVRVTDGEVAWTFDLAPLADGLPHPLRPILRPFCGRLYGLVAGPFGSTAFCLDET
jgi:hypothetical protein